MVIRAKNMMENGKNQRTISICFTIPQLTGGGAERVVSVLASTLANMGHDVHIIVYDKLDNEYPTSERVKKYYLSNEKYSNNVILRRIQRIRYVRNYIKNNNIEYSVAFLRRAVVQTFLSTRGLRIKFVSTVRNNPYEFSKYERLMTDTVALFSDAHFVQNEMQKAYYCKIVQKKTFILTNPVSDVFLKERKTYSDDVKKIVAIGRLEAQKNYDMLIYAIKLVAKKHPEVRVDIWGQGAEEERLKLEIKGNGLEGIIVLKGRSNNIKKVLEESDLFVMTSNYEGMPNSLLEAMAFGMPCISTDCPTGPSELIENCVNGYLVNVNDIDGLAMRICELMDNPAITKIIGDKARKSVEKTYSASYIAESFFKQLMEV